MRRSVLRVIRASVVALGIVMGGASTASAQGVPAADLSVGYQFLRLEEESLGLGWYVDLAGNWSETLAIVGQVAGSYGSVADFVNIDIDAHSFLGGIRFSGRGNPSLVPFAHALVGIIRVSAGTNVIGVNVSESDSSAAMQLGGGVTMKATEKLGVRIGADFLRAFEDSGANGFRFAAGVVIPIRSR